MKVLVNASVGGGGMVGGGDVVGVRVRVAVGGINVNILV